MAHSRLPVQAAAQCTLHDQEQEILSPLNIKRTQPYHYASKKSEKLGRTAVTG